MFDLFAQVIAILSLVALYALIFYEYGYKDFWLLELKPYLEKRRNKEE